MQFTALKRVRLERGLRQKTVSRAIGISQSHLSGLENANLVMNEDVLARLSCYYRVPQKQLI